MQLKNCYIVLLFLFIFSCHSYDKKSEKITVLNEEVAVLATIYNATPKFIPPPPPSKNGMDSIFKKQKKLIFAVYDGFIDLESRDYVSNVFYKYRSNKLFREVSIDSVSIHLARSLKLLDYNEKIQKKELTKYVDENLIFINVRYPNREKKREYKIDEVISFSRVAFDSAFKKAAVCVETYYDKLSTSQCIYILEKENNKWKIKFVEVVEIS